MSEPSSKLAKGGLLIGIAAIITAVVPLFTNDAGDRADKADAKSELVLELVKQHIEFLDKQVDELKENDREFRKFIQYSSNNKTKTSRDILEGAGGYTFDDDDDAATLTSEATENEEIPPAYSSGNDSFVNTASITDPLAGLATLRADEDECEPAASEDIPIQQKAPSLPSPGELDELLDARKKQ